MARLIFKKIDIRKAPGFRRGINAPLETLSPEINILTGPNGAGKSTVARIIQKLIWHDDPRGYDAGGAFELNGEEWTTEIDSAFSRYRRNGAESVPEGLPSSGTQPVYYLALHDLVKAEDGNLAKNILEESIGGYDLEKAHSNLDYSRLKVTRGATEYTEYNEAAKKLIEVTDLHRQLRHEEITLSSLEESRAKAEKAAEMKELYKLSADYLSAKQKLEEADSKMTRYPVTLQQVTGDELTTIEECETEAIEESRIIRETENKILEFETRLKGLKVPETGIDDCVLNELKERSKRIAEYEREIRQIKDPSIECQATTESEARKKIGNIRDAEAWKGIDINLIGNIDEFFNNALSIFKQKRLNETEIEILEKRKEISNPPAQKENLSEGITILGNWLKEGKGSGMPEWPIITIMGLSLVLVIMLAVKLSPWFTLPVAAIIIVFAVTAMIFYRKGNTSLKIRESDYTRTGLTRPVQWDSAGVTERLAELLKEFHEEKLREAEDLSGETRLNDLYRTRDSTDKELTNINLKKDKLLEKLNAIPDFPGNLAISELYLFLSNLQVWQSAVIRLEGLRSEKESLGKSIKEELEKCNIILETLNTARVSDSSGLEAILGQLFNHEAQRRDLSGKIDTCNNSLSESRERKAKAIGKTCSVYLKLGIGEGKKDEVESLLSMLDDYRKDKQEQSNARASFTEKEDNLLKHHLYEINAAELACLDLQQCRQKMEDLSIEAGRMTDLLRDITRIETKVQEKKSGRELEDVLTAKNIAVINLEKLHDQHLSSIAGSILIENLQKETEEMSRPEVFRRADQYFRKITAGKYELRVSGGNRFMAFDTKQKETLDLSSISTGTRLQLLLSVRLAFIEQQERGVKLPVIADELLANSDDQRAEAIISALYEISKEGRQVFYLTAQTDEALKWRDFLQSKDAGFRIIPMDEGYYGQENLVHRPEIAEMVLSRAVTPPDGIPVKQYRKIVHIPLYDLMCDIPGTLSIGYLTEDTGLLYRCLKSGMETWGQLKGLDFAGHIEGLDSVTLGIMNKKIQLLNDFQSLYRQGRSRRIDMDVILRSGAITDNFRDLMKEKLDESGGDPIRLIANLPKGFRQKNKEMLESYLTENGFINDGKPLSIELIKPRLVETSVAIGLELKEAENFINGIIDTSSN